MPGVLGWRWPGSKYWGRNRCSIFCTYPGIEMETVLLGRSNAMVMPNEVSVTERSNFEFVFMFFKRLYKVICVGLCTETYSKIIDDEAEHDVARGVPE